VFGFCQMGGHTAVVVGMFGTRLEYHSLCRISVGVLGRYVLGMFSVSHRNLRDGDWLQDLLQWRQRCTCIERWIGSGGRRLDRFERLKIRMGGIWLTLELLAKGWRLQFSGCGQSEGKSG